MNPAISVVCLAFLSADPEAIRPQPERGMALAVRVDNTALIHTAQLYPHGPAVVPTTPGEQASQVVSQLDQTLRKVDGTLADVIKLNVYVAHASVTPHVERELKSRFQNGRLPAVCVVETELPWPGVVVAMDAVAVTKRQPDHADLILNQPQDQTAMLSFLPQGSVSYISGQAERGDGTLSDATRATMDSLFKTLAFLGRQPTDVVHIKAFLTPISEADVATKAIAAAFADVPCPPVSLVQWDSNLPIEIEMIVADKPLDGVAPTALPIEYLTPPGMTASPIYARVTRVHAAQRIYVSGLLAQQESTAAEEVGNLFSQLTQVLESSGSDFQHLAKATYYVSNNETSQELNRQRPQHYHPQRPPAASKALVMGTGQTGRHITLDMIAVVKP